MMPGRSRLPKNDGNTAQGHATAVFDERGEGAGEGSWRGRRGEDGETAVSPKQPGAPNSAKKKGSHSAVMASGWMIC